MSLFRSQNAAEQSYFWPLRDVSFKLNAGDTVGIIGNNGSGKSTLLKLISGILELTSGTIRVNGRISSLLELGAGFHPDLTGRENIYLNGSIYGLTHNEINERIEQIIDFSELREFIDTPVKHYSSGMYVRLGFAVAVQSEPDVLLIDEVLAVGDARFQAKCLDTIQNFREQGGTLILVSHSLSAIESICNRVIWLEQGRIQEEGSPTDVIMAYQSHIASEENTVHKNQVAIAQKAAAAGARRWGSGEVQIIQVELCNNKGEPQTAFFTGEELEVRLHYHAPQRVEHIIFGLAIHHQNGTHITGPNSRSGGLSIPFVEGKGEVIYRIETLSLMEGTYFFSFAVHDEADTKMFDYHDRLYKFRVYRGSFQEQFGLVTLNGSWQINQYPSPLLVDPDERIEETVF
ncbi:ABC transporter ATP-binding protein [Chloroflexi bacterium TSY]|nr:ABC transporter ATP-binding protein [Chloroflexi bacterium TSY]